MTLALVFILGLMPVVAWGELRQGEAGLDGVSIEQQADELEVGYRGERRAMTLVLLNAQGTESVRRMNYEAYEGDNRRDKTIIRFHYPPDTKGTSLLTYENGKSDDEQWLYMPSLRRVKRIASSNQSGSFMGSEFAYEDLVVRQIEKYTFRYLGDEIVDGQDCYVIEGIPHSKNSGYSKVIRWRLKSNFQELKTKFFDRKGELLKQRTAEGHHQVDGFWRIKKVTVKNVQTNKSSILINDDIQLKETMSARTFHVRNFWKRS